MEVGYRGMAAFWIGGIATGAAAPEPSCPCPDWTVEGTLLNQFVSDSTLVNGFAFDATLADDFVVEGSLLNLFIQKAEQSTNPWRKKNCE